VVTVTSTLDGDAAWLTFAARAEPSLAPAPADAAAATEPVAAATPDAGAPGPVAAAAAINARVAGWQYRIPEYQHGQLTRRWADLLKAPE
jgi:hypothetical protein